MFHWRRVGLNDSDRLLAWRNDPLTVRFSKSNSPVSRKEHQDWLKQIVASRETQSLIGEYKQTPIASVRFDPVGKSRGRYKVSINLAPHQRGRGMGAAILKSALAHFSKKIGAEADIVAEIHKNNVASHKIFLKNGFEYVMHSKKEAKAVEFDQLIRRHAASAAKAKGGKTPRSPEIKATPSLRRVKKHEADADILYALLRARVGGISHSHMPTPKDHRDFVFNHPYRFWYLVEIEKTAIGSLYFHYDNSIGVNLPGQPASLLSKVIEKALTLHRPLAPIASVRARHFFINTQPQDRRLAQAIKSLGWEVLQVSYAPAGPRLRRKKDV